VVGLDDTHRAQLERIDNSDHYHFIPLFRKEQVKTRDFPVAMILEKGPLILDEFDGSVDAIIGYWDFPVSTILPILRQHCGLPGPSLESVLKCEHKYWSRCEQVNLLPQHIPKFQSLNPFSQNPLNELVINFPFWIKPVKSLLSNLGFRVNNQQDFDHAIKEIRNGIGRFGNPFNQVLSYAVLPEHIAPIDGYHCIVEELISAGHQCTVEGYALDDDVCVYGVVDSIREGRHLSSFSRYQYPSLLPESVRRRMKDISKKFIRHIGLNTSTFNIEFFWNPDTDKIFLLEVNPRASKSHSSLFERVDGVSHLQVMVEVALQESPRYIQGRGKHAISGKFMVRRESDAYVVSVPVEKDLARVREKFPGTEIEIHIRPGMRLSEMSDQDSYSYEVAVMFMGAGNEEELLENYHAALEMLPFIYSE